MENMLTNDDAGFKEAAANLNIQNDPMVEYAWAKRTTEHMEVHFNILCSVDPKNIRLTPYDDEIYHKFKSEFPGFNLEVIDEESLKGEEAKKKWRAFHFDFSSKINDSAFATMIRIDSKKDYSEKNSLLVLRLQFLAIEIARNREGLNDSIKDNFKPVKQ